MPHTFKTKDINIISDVKTATDERKYKCRNDIEANRESKKYKERNEERNKEGKKNKEIK